MAEYDEDEQYESDYDITDDILSGDFVGDIIAMAKQHVREFFGNRIMYCGGCIPNHLLFSKKRISLLLNTEIGDCIDLAYDALEKTIDPKVLAKAERTGDITSDIKLVRDSLDMIARSGVPKCLAGGILLMYLEFCEGVEFS